MAATKPKILVVESYHAEYPWDISYKSQLEAMLSTQYQLSYFELDTKRIPTEQFEAKAAQAWQYYLELQPELVILADDHALRLLGQKFVGTETPVVYLGINNNPRYYGMVGHPNITGVLERPLLKRSLVMLNHFFPVSRVLILFDGSMTAQIVKDETFSGQSSAIYGGVQVDLKLVEYLSDWQELVLGAEQAGYDAIIVGLYQRILDSKGEHVPDTQILDWTSRHTSVPPFAFWDFAVGIGGAIGGYVQVGAEQGFHAAQLAKALLEGREPPSLPKTALQGQLLFSQAELKRWQIAIPADLTEKVKLVP